MPEEQQRDLERRVAELEEQIKRLPQLEEQIRRQGEALREIGRHLPRNRGLSEVSY